jgi:hypothetical protein
VGFVADKMTLGVFYFQALPFVTVSIIPPVPHIHTLFLQNQSHMSLISDNSVTTKKSVIFRRNFKGFEVL